MSEDGPTVQYVGFWLRFVAFLIDSTVATLLISPVAIMVLGEIDTSTYDLTDPVALAELSRRLLVQTSFDIVVLGVIFVLFWVYRSATPGKMLFHAIIVRADDFGKPSTTQLIIRYLGYFVCMIPMFLGFFWIGWNRQKQGWHDLMAGTTVIRDPSST